MLGCAGNGSSSHLVFGAGNPHRQAAKVDGRCCTVSPRTVRFLLPEFRESAARVGASEALPSRKFSTSVQAQRCLLNAAEICRALSASNWPKSTPGDTAHRDRGMAKQIDATMWSFWMIGALTDPSPGVRSPTDSTQPADSSEAMASGSKDSSRPLEPCGSRSVAPTGSVALSSCRESTDATQTLESPRRIHNWAVSPVVSRSSVR